MCHDCNLQRSFSWSRAAAISRSCEAVSSTTTLRRPKFLVRSFERAGGAPTDWEKSYKGFDDADWAKAQAWAAEPLPVRCCSCLLDLVLATSLPR